MYCQITIYIKITNGDSIQLFRFILYQNIACVKFTICCRFDYNLNNTLSCGYLCGGQHNSSYICKRIITCINNTGFNLIHKRLSIKIVPSCNHVIINCLCITNCYTFRYIIGYSFKCKCKKVLDLICVLYSEIICYTCFSTNKCLSFSTNIMNCFVISHRHTTQTTHMCTITSTSTYTSLTSNINIISNNPRSTECV